MNTVEFQQDFFISHASADKAEYVEPLSRELSQRGLTYWLDTIELSWGDWLALKINEGLARSRYVLLCLSEAFLGRPWPETEMNAALSMANEQGVKKVLPLFLNSKEMIIRKYPMIGGLVYREFGEGLHTIGAELASLAGKSATPEGHIQVTVESIHTGQLSNVVVSPRVSVKWLSERARQGAGLKDQTETGGFEGFRIRWVLVDVKAEQEWEALPRHEKRSIHTIIKAKDGLRISRRSTDRLSDFGIYSGIVFHLYAIEDIDFDLLRYEVAPR